MKTFLYNFSIIAVALILATSGYVKAQQPYAVLMIEDFNDGTVPTGWSTSVNTPAFPDPPNSVQEGWQFLDAAGVTASYGGNTIYWSPLPPDNGGNFAVANDDECNCDASNDVLTTPMFDMSRFDSLWFFFDLFSTGQWGSVANLDFTVDSGSTWSTIAAPTDPAAWQGLYLPLIGPFTGVQFSFVHSDGSTNGSDLWADGAAVDSILLAGFNTPCDDVIDITACGESHTVSLGGQGVNDWNFTGGCGFGVPGAEQLFTFTPTVSGVHTINVSSTTGASWLDYMYKPVSSGCDSLGWNCVDDVIDPGAYGGLDLTAGIQYYILLDNEYADVEDQTFTIECPCTFVGSYFSEEAELCGSDDNGGCGNDPDPATYEPIVCGQTITGTLWADAGARDVDWFELVVTDATDINVDFGGSLPMNCILIDNCTDFNGLATATSDACGVGSLTFAAVPGTYLLAVVPTGYYGYPCGALNEYDLYVNYCVPPANDECAGAVSLTPGITCSYTGGNTLAASQSMPACDAGDPGTADDDVWFSFTATSTEMTVEVVGSASFDVVFEVFSGTCGSLSSEACQDTSFSFGGTESVTLPGLTIGQTYYVRVYNWYPINPSLTTEFDICVFSSPITGIAATSGDHLAVYPNPSDGRFAIALDDASDKVEMSVLDMTGRQVYHQWLLNKAGTEQTFDLRLASGSYLLKLTSDSSTRSVRLEVK